jgi:hypothetical protein
VLKPEFDKDEIPDSTGRLVALIPHRPITNLPKLLAFTLSKGESVSLLRCMAHLVDEGVLKVEDMFSFCHLGERRPQSSTTK